MNTRLLATLCLAIIPTAATAQPPDDETAVAVEVRILTVPADWMLAGVPAKEGEIGLLKSAQVKALLEAAQSHRRANVLQAPKVTLSHNECIEVKMVDNQSFVKSVEAAVVDGRAMLVPKSTSVEIGTTFSLAGRIAADRSSATVDVKYFDRRLERVESFPVTTLVEPAVGRGKSVPFTQHIQAPHFVEQTIAKKDVRIANGGHAVIAGPSFMAEQREEYRIPVLAELPWIGRPFRTVGIGKVNLRTILILSPTVIRMEE